MNQLKLIDGIYTPADATEILLQLIYRKIDYLNLKVLSQRIRNGSADAHTERRIEELKDLLKQVRHLIDEAETEGKKINIQSTISLELI